MTTTLPLIRIVDDDEELRNSQKMLLASLGWSVKTYESALAFLSDDELTRPGCLILDVRMPGMTGLELQQELMRRGAVDFLEKPVQPQKLLQRVTTAVARTIQKTAREEELTDLRERLGKLTGREREVAKLLSEGMRNKEIARSLGIEETTVKMHRANLQAKLGVKSTAELTRIFITVEILSRENC
jgi:two component response regulator